MDFNFPIPLQTLIGAGKIPIIQVNKTASLDFFPAENETRFGLGRDFCRPYFTRVNGPFSGIGPLHGLNESFIGLILTIDLLAIHICVCVVEGN